MSIKRDRIAALALVLGISAFGHIPAQAQNEPSRLAQRFIQADTERRAAIAENMFGAGSTDRSFYEAVATSIEAQLETLTKRDGRISEVGWSIKALGGSGDDTYLPLIERAARSQIRAIAADGEEALEILLEAKKSGRPFLLPEKVRVVTESQANECEYLTQAVCEARQGADACMDDHRQDAIIEGGNAILVVDTSAGGAFFSSTTVIANYYDCRDEGTSRANLPIGGTDKTRAGDTEKHSARASPAGATGI